MPAIRIGTRPSRLAVRQAEMVSDLLQSNGFETELVAIDSTGDVDRTTPLYLSKGTGVFVEEINRAVLDGRTEIAVHSAKDLPSILPAGLDVLAVLPREDPSDVLISSDSLMTLPPGAVIGTSSIRRIRELRMVRADLKVADLRGNLDTRIRKYMDGEYDGIIVAKAGFNRLSLGVHVEQLSIDDFLPAPNQGIIAVVGKTGSNVADSAEKISHNETMEVYQIERHLIRTLNLGCSMPVGILCTKTETGYRVKCRFYSNFMREYKEFNNSIGSAEDLEGIVDNIRDKVPPSYGYNFGKRG